MGYDVATPYLSVGQMSGAGTSQGRDTVDHLNGLVNDLKEVFVKGTEWGGEFKAPMTGMAESQLHPTFLSSPP